MAIVNWFLSVDGKVGGCTTTTSTTFIPLHAARAAVKLCGIYAQSRHLSAACVKCGLQKRANRRFWKWLRQGPFLDRRAGSVLPPIGPRVLPRTLQVPAHEISRVTDRGFIFTVHVVASAYPPRGRFHRAEGWMFDQLPGVAQGMRSNASPSRYTAGPSLARPTSPVGRSRRAITINAMMLSNAVAIR